MAVIDVFTYNGEADILEIRLNILYPYVDQFIIVEAPTTFSGHPKPLYYEQQKERFAPFADKIKYVVNIGGYTEDETRQAKESPNTQGAYHWKREFLQKESIKKALTHLDDKDTVFVGDVDEIWEPEAAQVAMWTHGFVAGAIKLKLRVYTYWLNNRSSEKFWGTVVAPYKLIKESCLNHLRSDKRNRNFIEMGWHFTSMAPGLEQKLKDSYTDESYATPAVINMLGYNMAQNKDFLGRDFTYTRDEADWPVFLRENREHYKHLIKE